METVLRVLGADLGQAADHTAVRWGLQPAALAECEAQPTGITQGLERLVGTMARRALEPKEPPDAELLGPTSR